VAKAKCQTPNGRTRTPVQWTPDPPQQRCNNTANNKTLLTARLQAGSACWEQNHQQTQPTTTRRRPSECFCHQARGFDAGKLTTLLCANSQAASSRRHTCTRIFQELYITGQYQPHSWSKQASPYQHSPCFRALGVPSPALNGARGHTGGSSPCRLQHMQPMDGMGTNHHHSMYCTTQKPADAGQDTLCVTNTTKHACEKFTCRCKGPAAVTAYTVKTPSSSCCQQL